MQYSSNAFFYDISSIKRDGNKVKVWSYNNVKQDDKLAKSMNVGSMRSLDEIDCVNETYSMLALHFYTNPDLDGNMRSISIPSKEIDYIVPKSTHSRLMKLVCKKWVEKSLINLILVTKIYLFGNLPPASKHSLSV